MIVVSDDTEPGERYVFDRDTKALTKQYQVFEKLPRQHLAEMKPIRYKSADGLEVPAYLTLPRGVAPKNLPTIIVPHGGPWARDQFGYSAMAQFFANRGYAVLQPNFRGSAGYGKKFLNAGNNEWGGKMQDDVTWGVKHLVSVRHCQSQTSGHSRWVLWRVRDACGRGVHAGSVRRRRLHCRSVEPHDAARVHPAILGIGPQDIPLAHGRSDDAGGQETTRASVAVVLRGEDQDAAARGPGRQRSAREEGGVRSNRHRPPRPQLSRSNTSSRRTKGTALRGR